MRLKKLFKDVLQQNQNVVSSKTYSMTRLARDSNIFRLDPSIVRLPSLLYLLFEIKKKFNAESRMLSL